MTPLPFQSLRHPTLMHFPRQARISMILTLRQISPMMRLMLTYAISPQCMIHSPFTLLRQVFNEELDVDRSVVDKTVNLSVADGEWYRFMDDPIINDFQMARKSKHKLQTVRELQRLTHSRKDHPARNQVPPNPKFPMRPL